MILNELLSEVFHVCPAGLVFGHLTFVGFGHVGPRGHGHELLVGVAQGRGVRNAGYGEHG
jgi:hypothetical protein